MAVTHCIYKIKHNMQVCKLYVTPIMFCTTADPGSTKIKIKKWRLGLKLCITSAILKIIKAYQPYRYHFQANVIWCDGTFNHNLFSC